MWVGKRFSRPRELESLFRYFHHACKVAPLGRSFLCRMMNLLCTFRHYHHPIGLNQEFQQNPTWLRELCQAGMTSVSSRCHKGPPCLTSRCHLKQVSQKPLPIAYRKLFPLVVAAHLWGPQWTSQQVESVCDNSHVSGGSLVF